MASGGEGSLASHGAKTEDTAGEATESPCGTMVATANLNTHASHSAASTTGTAPPTSPLPSLPTVDAIYHLPTRPNICKIRFITRTRHRAAAPSQVHTARTCLHYPKHGTNENNNAFFGKTSASTAAIYSNGNFPKSPQHSLGWQG